MSFVEPELLAKEKEEAAAGDGSGNDEVRTRKVLRRY